MASRRIGLIDGREIVVSTDDADLSNPWTSIARYDVDGNEFEFTAGSRDFGRAVAAEVGCSFTETVRMPPGTLHVGGTSVTSRVLVGGGEVRRQDTDVASENAFVELTEKVVVGSWEGENYSVHLVVWGGETEPGVIATDATAQDLADVVWLFDQFEISESPFGVRMRPLAVPWGRIGPVTSVASTSLLVLLTVIL